MEKSLSIGPLALPMGLAVIIAAVVVALVVDAGIRRIRKVEGESPVITIFLVAVFVARLAFVAAYFDEYRETPLRMVDIRDGGFNVTAGVLSGLAMFAWHFIRTLAETTPVLEAANLQADLRRAGIEPWAWVVNQSMAAARPSAPLLRERATSELLQIDTVAKEHARRWAIVPMQAREPVGIEQLAGLTGHDAGYN